MTLDEKEKALTSDIFELHTPDIDSFQFLATGDIVQLFCKNPILEENINTLSLSLGYCECSFHSFIQKPYKNT
jgi:hypothetical protein